VVVGAHLYIVVLAVAIVIRIDKPNLINLIEHIVCLEHVTPNQLSAAVDWEGNGFGGTVLVGGIIDGLQDALGRVVENVDVVPWIDLVLFKVLFHHLVAPSFWLMKNDGLVVGVVLIKDGIEGELIGKAV
jgi:hypothetical protein